MNLGIEYLIRTGAIKEFFDVPSTLCLEHWQGDKVIIGIEDLMESNFLVTHWNLEELNPENDFPKFDIYHVSKDDVFTSDKIILRGEFSLLPYSEQSVIATYNRYSHPMDNETYHGFLNSLLDSKIHQMEREVWLWRSFMKLNISKPVLHLYHYEKNDRLQIVMTEQKNVYDQYPKKWNIWRCWRKRMLQIKKAAPELVFYAEYN